jgi:16S rRNA (cytidine1402-2'-O)-methyltransferase
MRATLMDIQEIFGDRMMAIGRELTKIHENLVVRPTSEHLAALSEERGEFTLVVAGVSLDIEEISAPEAAKIAERFWQLTNSEGLSRREAIRTLAREFRVSAREVFSLLDQARHLAE